MEKKDPLEGKLLILFQDSHGLLFEYMIVKSNILFFSAQMITSYCILLFLFLFLRGG